MPAFLPRDIPPTTVLTGPGPDYVALAPATELAAMCLTLEIARYGEGGHWQPSGHRLSCGNMASRVSELANIYRELDGRHHVQLKEDLRILVNGGYIEKVGSDESYYKIRLLFVEDYLMPRLTHLLPDVANDH